MSQRSGQLSDNGSNQNETDEEKALRLLNAAESVEESAALAERGSTWLSTITEVITAMSRFLIALIVIVAFAWATVAVLGLADIGDKIDLGSLPAPPTDPEKLPAYLEQRELLIEQNKSIVDAAMRPLDFADDFLSGFILPVVTLIIGFYFGKEVGERTKTDD